MKFKKEPVLELEDDDKAPTGNRAILFVYGLFCLSLFFICTPVIKIHTAGSLLLLFTLFSAWCLRFGKPHDTLIYNHMIYISRTIWMMSLIITAAVAVAGYVVYTLADNSIMQSAFDEMMEGRGLSHQELAGTLMEYLKANFMLMLSGALLCAVPTLLYTVYRLQHGITRALKGHRLAKPESWF